MDTGQHIWTYLLFNFLPIIIFILFRLAYPTKTLATVISKTAPWCLWGKPCAMCHKRIKRYMIPVRNYQAKNKNSGATIRTYLFSALFNAYKVGCCMEIFLQRFSGPPTWAPSYLALQSEAMLQSASSPVRFNSDSYPIGVDSHTSKCMAINPHFFEDLRLNKDKGQVDGISNRLVIKGEGTFKFAITNNEGKKHTIKIPNTNSLYVPKMRRCLLLPQHWVQEAGDKQTWMENKRQWPYDCVLNWKGGKKTNPHQLLTKVPVLYTTSSSMPYRSFVATFEAMEGSFFEREKVLQYPGHRDLMDDIEPEEFVAEENLNYNKGMSVNEGVTEDKEKLKHPTYL